MDHLLCLGQDFQGITSSNVPVYAFLVFLWINSKIQNSQVTGQFADLLLLPGWSSFLQLFNLSHMSESPGSASGSTGLGRT